MARKPAPKPQEELALLEYLTEVKLRLEAFGPEDPIAKLGVDQAKQGLHVWEKYLKRIYEELLSGSHPATRNVVDFEGQVKLYAKVLEDALKAAGKKAEVDQVHKDHNGLVPVAEALIEKAKASPTKTVTPASDELKDALQAYKEQDARKKESGHSVFDAETVKLGRKAWASLDNAYDALGMRLRLDGIEFDPVYAKRPSIQSVLRPIVRSAPAQDSKAVKGKKAAAGKGNKGEGENKNPDTPPSPPAKSTDGSAPPA